MLWGGSGKGGGVGGGNDTSGVGREKDPSTESNYKCLSCTDQMFQCRIPASLILGGRGDAAGTNTAGRKPRTLFCSNDRKP